MGWNERNQEFSLDMLMSRCLLDILEKMFHKQFDIEKMYEKNQNP